MQDKASRRRDCFLFVAGGILGAVAFLLVLGLSPLDVTQDAFCRDGYIEKDIQQHYAGWLFYRESPLSFPLCIADSINWPDGLSVAFTDSIPLFAAVFRLLEPVLPATFQYFGWYTLLCLVLQGAIGARLLGLFAPGRWLPLAGDLWLVFSPVLWERVLRHTSLAAQFLLLGTLYYYVLSGRQQRYAYRGLFALNVLGITLHPYFVPMTFAITLATLLRHAWRQHKFAGPALFLGSNLAATVAVGWALGLFQSGAGGGSDALYGYFGLNLNSLWNPAGVGSVDWSLFLPKQNQVGGNYDAFAYLGLGVLLALAVGAAAAAAERRLHPLRLLRRHAVLCGICAMLTVFAVSHTITANGVTLATLPLPGQLIQLCSVFRSSGRLFWPVYYLMMLAAFVGLCRIRGKQWLPAALVAGLAALQLLDLTPGLWQRRTAFAAAQQQETYPSELTSNFWDEAAGRYRTIASMDGLQNDALHLALYAADHDITTNDPFAARYDAEALAAQRQTYADELAAGTLREDTLYLFADEGAFLQAVEPVSQSGAWCGRIDGVSGSWYVIAPGMAEIALDSSCIRYDKNYPLRLADYTDALWNHGVLDGDRRIICFADAPFTREKLEGAATLSANGKSYRILQLDDSDPGWLMVTLDIEDATVLWGQELETE